MTKAIDPKYSIRLKKSELGTEPVIVKTQTGESVPEDEPLILFRAHDRVASKMLRVYRHLCELDGCTSYHLEGITNRILAFEGFAQNHPDRMKQPGITKGE